MLELDYALNLIIKGIENTTKGLNFKLEYPDGILPPAVPVFTDGKKSYVMYRGDKGRVRIEYENQKLALYCADSENDDAPDDDMPRASLSLLDLEEFDERDLKYIFEEYNETITKAFVSKHELRKNTSTKLPTPVSKSQAKSGALSYDATTLGLRFTTIFPELRDEYKHNIDEYGEFLAEDFFINFGNNAVISTVRENDKVKMRKLFNLLGEIYEDGTNDTQSLIAVTILGSMASDAALVNNLTPYLTETMEEPVGEVLKYLASSKSKSARMRLQTPPLYKPKKAKKKGAMSSMLGM